MSFPEYFLTERELSSIQLPGKYLGIEKNAYDKKAQYNILACFPDDYSIAMSSLGYHTVCNIINMHPDFACERCFAPAADMESYLRVNDLGLLSLENKIPAKDFDIIAFSVHYELSYTNLLFMMDLAGINFRREQRKAEDPLIIAGGPICVNPNVLSAFCDVVVIGEAETILPLMLDKYSNTKNKASFLESISGLEGVYVPGISESVKKTVSYELNNKYYPVKYPVPVVDIVHNRLNIELNRGCRNSCRFCQAASIYFPYREKTKDDVLEIARRSIASSGYEELVLTSLSATDHAQLPEIMDELDFAFRDLGVSTSLSSMRFADFEEDLAVRLSKLKRSGITFAPETVSSALKRIINKHLDNDKIIRASVIAKNNGWKKIKLYFLVGLPGETVKDVEAIIDFVKKVKSASGLNVNVSVNPLVPQPHTPFQWLVPENPEELLEKINILRKKIGNTVKTFSKGQYIVETILTRAGMNLAEVVEAAYRKGAKFDQWTERFEFDLWRTAFEDKGYDWEELYYTHYSIDDPLPWDYVDVGIKKEYFKASYRAVIEEVSRREGLNHV